MPWQIYADLSGVVEMPVGLHPTEEAALEALVLHLESNKTDITDKLAKAKARRRVLARRKAHA